MKVYNVKNFVKILFSVTKGDTLNVLAKPMLGVLLYSSLIYYLEIEYMKLNENSTIKNISMVYSLLSFVISLLLVFRTNTAYDRWWEGRKLWGKLTNDSRNLAIKINACLDKNDTENRAFFVRYLSFFPHLLSRHLSQETTRLALGDDYSELEKSMKQHPPLELISIISKKIHHLFREGKISGEELLYLDTQLSGYLDVCGGCERIKNTPIPISYSSFVKKFIIIYVVLLPIAYVVNIGVLMIPLTIFVFYILMSLEVIAEEIEDPFSGDENDLPIEKISQNIEKNIHLIFEK